MSRSQVIVTALLNLTCIGISTVLITSEYGWKTGLAVGLISWTLMPFTKED